MYSRHSAIVERDGEPARSPGQLQYHRLPGAPGAPTAREWWGRGAGKPLGHPALPAGAVPASSKPLWLLARSQLGLGGCGEVPACQPLGTVPRPVPALRAALTQPEEPYLAPAPPPNRQVTATGSPPPWPGPTSTACSLPWLWLPSAWPRPTLSNNTRSAPGSGARRAECLPDSVPGWGVGAGDVARQGRAHWVSRHGGWA